MMIGNLNGTGKGMARRVEEDIVRKDNRSRVVEGHGWLNFLGVGGLGAIGKMKPTDNRQQRNWTADSHDEGSMEKQK